MPHSSIETIFVPDDNINFEISPLLLFVLCFVFFLFACMFVSLYSNLVFSIAAGSD